MGDMQNLFETPNKAYIIGKILRLESKGVHDGVNQVLVCVEDLRESKKRNHALVLLPDCASTNELIEKNAIIHAEGILTASYTFNNLEKKHIFIVPNTVKELPEDFKLDPIDEFYLNYTLYNRVILRGVISSEPTTRYIDSVGRSLMRFKLNFLGDGGREKSINCTLWETVNDLSHIKKGDEVGIIASFNITNRYTLSRERSEAENKETKETKDYTSYNLLVQKIYDLGRSPEAIAEEIYVKD